MAHRLGGFALALLIVAGQIKANPALQWVPVDITVLALGLVLLMMLVSRMKDGPATPWVWLPFVVWVGALITLLIGVYPSAYGAAKVQTFYTVTLLLAVAPFYLLRDKRQRSAFLFTIVGVGVFSIISVLSSAPDENLYGRVSAEGTDTIGTARLVMGGAIILAVFAIAARKRAFLRLAATGAAGVLAVVALMTGSRGPALAAGIALAIAVIFSPQFKKYRVRAITAMVIIGGAAVWWVSSRDNVGFGRILELFTGGTDRSILARNTLWQIASESAVIHPVGMGWGSFEAVGGINPYPHNLVLEIAYEQGWGSVLLLLILLVAGVVAAVRRASDVAGVALLALLIFSIFNAMVSSDINGSRLLVVTLFAAWAVPTALKARVGSAAENLDAKPTVRGLRQRNPIRSR